MCILRVSGGSRSFKSFADGSNIPVFSVADKGDIKNKNTGEVYSEFRISFDVSSLDWDDFPGQVQDAIRFLNEWHTDIEELIRLYKPDNLMLDFPIYSRLNNIIANQNDYLPPELLSVVGRLGIGICISMYSVKIKEFM